MNAPTVPRPPNPPRAGQNQHKETTTVHFFSRLPDTASLDNVAGSNTALFETAGGPIPVPRGNRHQRRRQEALLRQNKGRLSGDAPSTTTPAPRPPEPPAAPPDPRLLLLQNVARWAVEGINEDGKFLCFLARFSNGDAIVVLDPTDEVNAEEIVRSALAGRAQDGFIGIMLPTIQDGQIQMAAQRNSARAQDMDLALQIATQAVARKSAQPKENIGQRPRPEGRGLKELKGT